MAKVNTHKGWSSRKLVVALVASAYTLAASVGFKVPVEQTALVDGILVFWILIEFVLDIVKK